MHKQRIAANDGTDFTALSVESTLKQDVVDSTRPLYNYVRSSAKVFEIITYNQVK